MRKSLFFLLIPFFLFACKSQPLPPPIPLEPLTEPEIFLVIPEIIEEAVIIEEVIEDEPVIEIIKPVFTIVSIAVIQADLINTEFQTVVRIDNPNEFAVDLSSLSYELYGNGRFWGDGAGKDILHIPAHSSCEAEFRFIMNFINMNRRLLDDIVAMRQVNYRFKGEAHVEIDIPKIPAFITNFERTGFSEVRKKTGR